MEETMEHYKSLKFVGRIKIIFIINCRNLKGMPIKIFLSPTEVKASSKCIIKMFVLLYSKKIAFTQKRPQRNVENMEKNN